MSSQIPEGLRYAKSHEWVRVEGDEAVVGITDHAQQELTDVVFVELPAVGKTLAAAAPSAVVESVKTASDIYSPVSGTVIAVNDALNDQPGLVNTSPYQDGWFFRVKLDRPADLDLLMDSAAYAKQLSGE